MKRTKRNKPGQLTETELKRWKETLLAIYQKRGLIPAERPKFRRNVV